MIEIPLIPALQPLPITENVPVKSDTVTMQDLQVCFYVVHDFYYRNLLKVILMMFLKKLKVIQSTSFSLFVFNIF